MRSPNAPYLFLTNALLLCVWLIVRDFSLECSSMTLSQNQPTLAQKEVTILHMRQETRDIRPSAKRSNFTVAICAMVKDAEAYLTEWIDYNLMALEFDTIYLYDNSPNFDLQRWANQTRSHPIYSRVHVRHYPGRGGGFQVFGYNECMKFYARNHDYVAIIDVDEFIVLMQFPEKHSVIHDVLEEYLVPFGGALTMNWVLFGTSNKTVYSPIPVLKRFQYHDNAPHSLIKSIVRTSDFVSFKNAHAVTVQNNTKVHTTLYPGAIHEQQTSELGADDNKRPSDVILLYHYRFLSVKEYTSKRCDRGEPHGKVKGCDLETGTLNDKAPDHSIHRPGTVHDTRGWDFLTSKVPKYRVFDKAEFSDYT